MFDYKNYSILIFNKLIITFDFTGAARSFMIN